MYLFHTNNELYQQCTLTFTLHSIIIHKEFIIIINQFNSAFSNSNF